MELLTSRRIRCWNWRSGCRANGFAHKVETRAEFPSSDEEGGVDPEIDFLEPTAPPPHLLMVHPARTKAGSSVARLYVQSPRSPRSLAASKAWSAGRLRA